MSAGTQPVFVTTPKAPKVRISTANTGRDGAGTLGTLYTAGSNGSYFKSIRYQAEGTTTAGVVRIFIQTAGAGNNELIREMLVAAVTPSTSIEAASGEWTGPSGQGIMLGATDV